MGIASNALQIVDFGTRVIKTTYKLVSCTGDALREEIDLEKLAREQVGIVERLYGSLVATPVSDDNERALVAISGECKKESARLIGLLGELKVTAASHGIARVARSARAAVRAQRKREVIENHRKNLQLINGQLATALLSTLRYRS